MKLPRYNGEEPPETYHIQVQLVAQFNAWSAEEAAVQVTLALEGKALHVLTDLQLEERFNWPAIERVRSQLLLYPTTSRTTLRATARSLHGPQRPTHHPTRAGWHNGGTATHK